jgi:hypothetical protein
VNVKGSARRLSVSIADIFGSAGDGTALRELRPSPYD